ncbi:helix-turn-helix transcriptional regulator [Neisseriaceae bacterium ESL0693]|nr:helix-turn-helix transcriptional regulator [Neisseriaceae bacterium ESL0693]
MMNAIKEARRNKQLTQKQLAELVGCSASYIYKLEKYRAIASRKLAMLLAQTLDIDPIKILYPPVKDSDQKPAK